MCRSVGTFFLFITLVLLSSSVPAAPSLECRTAGQLMDRQTSEDFSKLCRSIVAQDPACVKILPSKRLNCSSKANNEIFSNAQLGSKALQCLKGFLVDSMVELGKFIIDLVKTLVNLQVKSYSDMYKILTDSDFRERTIQKAQATSGQSGRVAGAFLSSSAQYFAREYPKNLSRYHLDPLAALGATLLEPLLKFLTHAAQSIIAEYVPQFECMNGPAKLNTLCKFAGDFLMPPAFVFGWMKFGAKGLLKLAKTQGPKIAKLRAEFRAMNEGKEVAATSIAESKSAHLTLKISPPHPARGADYTAPIGSRVWERSGNDVKKAQRIYGEEITKKFPDLGYVLRDPDHFARTMDERFAAQKRRTPETPHLFDYSEVGVPLLRYMQDKLPEKIQELQLIQRRLKEGTADARTKKFYPLDEVNTNLAFLEDLLKETNEKLATGKITYKDTVELSAWFGQAVANFDTRQLPLKQRELLNFDRALEAHVEHPIEVEYAKYKRREFHLFDPEKKSITVGYREAGPGYEAAYLDKEKLGVIIIPSPVEIDCDVLYRLGNRQRLAITGVTKDPILADGFNRPAYDFWLHDVRHETVKYRYKNNYLQGNRIPKAKEEILNHQLDAWSLQLQQDITKIENQDVRRAAELISFNFYHDRGYPVAPSQYLNRPYKYIEYLLHSILTASGQGSQVRNPMSIRKASAWLEDYWKKKLPEEEAFLKTIQTAP